MDVSLPQVVAIIGHGRSPERKKWGEKINACRIVVRMWDWSWQNPEDYGDKYDYGLFEIDGQMLRMFRAHNKRTPTKGWVGSLLNDTMDPLPDNTEVVCQRPWTLEAKRMGGKGATGRLEFTRGTIATLWAIGRAAPGDNVVLVGFDNIRIGKHLPLEEAFSKEYRNSPGTFPTTGYKPGVSKHGNHDYPIERKIMEAVAARNSVTLSFAQNLWA